MNLFLTSGPGTESVRECLKRYSTKYNRNILATVVEIRVRIQFTNDYNLRKYSHFLKA